MRNQSIYDIAEICSQKGVVNAVLGPGSRSAPLTLAFTRHDKIQCRTFSDERSAGFIALGMAQQTQRPTALVCTSGTAAYNFAPAVAEAFFSQTPLLVFTADRPAEWVAQHDGQTIFQSELYGKHVKRSYTLPQQYDHPDDQWYINRIINEAINLATQGPKGPVHINAPFREPFYPDATKPFTYSREVRIIDEHAHYTLPVEVKEKLASELSGFKNILIVAGQHDFDQKLNSVLQTTAGRIPIVTGILSNLHGITHTISNADAFLDRPSDETVKNLKPDLLISFGNSVISKNLKLFLRKFHSIQHWHIQPYATSTDPFQNLTKCIVAHPSEFFEFFNNLKLPVPTHFLHVWKTKDNQIATAKADFFPLPELGELELVKEVLTKLPSNCNLHLANSMSVRYAEYIGLSTSKKDCSVFSNRGTSGIDGCTSTAVGHCFSSEPLNILITGDLGFFYDRNAFWHNYPLPNLRIVLLNNHGGVIFKLIDGPAGLPEADEYFVTQQKLTAKAICAEFGLEYVPIRSAKSLSDLLDDFFKPDGKTKILELESSIDLNKTIFEKFKQKITQHHEA